MDGVLDMTVDPDPEASPPVLPAHDPWMARFGCRVRWFARWMRGLMADVAVQNVHGEEWFRVFRLFRDDGLEAVRLGLQQMVDWDVPYLGDPSLASGPSSFCQGPSVITAADGDVTVVARLRCQGDAWFNCWPMAFHPSQMARGVQF